MVVGDNYEHVEGGGNMVKKIRTFIALLVLDTHTCYSHLLGVLAYFQYEYS